MDVLSAIGNQDDDAANIDGTLVFQALEDSLSSLDTAARKSL